MPGAKRKQACIGEGAGRPPNARVDDVLRAVIRSNDHSKQNIERIDIRNLNEQITLGVDYLLRDILYYYRSNITRSGETRQP